MAVLLTVAMSAALIWVNLRVGYILGAWRGRASDGLMLALFLGPLGWLLVMFLSADPESPTYRQPLHH